MTQMTLSDLHPTVLCLQDADAQNFLGTQDAQIDPSGIQAVALLKNRAVQVLHGEVAGDTLQAALAEGHDVLLLLAHEDGAQVRLDESVLILTTAERAHLTRRALSVESFVQRYETAVAGVLAAYIGAEAGA